jgi:phage shock protein C
MEKKELRLSSRNKKLGGVCGGIAEYFDVDPTIVRILWIAFSLAYGSGLLAYIICYFVIPAPLEEQS